MATLVTVVVNLGQTSIEESRPQAVDTTDGTTDGTTSAALECIGNFSDRPIGPNRTVFSFELNSRFKWVNDLITNKIWLINAIQ